GEIEFTDSDETLIDTTLPTLDSKTRTSAATAQPGDLITYQVVFTLPEGTTNGLTFTDTLTPPAGFEFVNTVSTVAGWGGALPGYATQPTAGQASPFTWTFSGPIVNPGDNNPANDTLTVTYRV